VTGAVTLLSKPDRQNRNNLVNQFVPSFGPQVVLGFVHQLEQNIIGDVPEAGEIVN